MNIIHTLHTQKIPFLISVSEVSFKNGLGDHYGKEYHIVTTDSSLTDELEFEVNEDVKNVYEKQLGESDITYFKNNLNFFKQVHKEKGGKLYEPIDLQTLKNFNR